MFSCIETEFGIRQQHPKWVKATPKNPRSQLERGFLLCVSLRIDSVIHRISVYPGSLAAVERPQELLDIPVKIHLLEVR